MRLVKNDLTPKLFAKKAVLRLVRLDDRVNPATYNWTGASDNTFTNPANWQGSHYPDQAGDVAIFDSKTGSNAPVLPSAASTTLPDMRITSGCNYDITIDGSLHVGTSNFGGSGGSVNGTGTLYLDSGAILMPGTANHHWVGTPVKVAHAEVKAFNYLEINGTNQLGPDGMGGTGSVLTDNGRIDVQGTHTIGYPKVEVKSGASLYTVANSQWNNINSSIKSTTDLFQVSNSGGTVQSNSPYTLDIQGGYYNQTGGTTTLNQAGGLNVGDTAGYQDGTTSYTRNVDVSGGKVQMYPFSGLTAAAGDVRFAGASLEVWSPGSYDHVVPPFTVTELCLVNLSGNTVRFEGTGTHIKFIDFTPAGATSPVQAGCALTVNGNLYIGGSTKLWLRADVGAGAYDKITTGPLSNTNIELNGDSLQLNLDIRNPGNTTSFTMYDFIQTGGTMTAPTTPFGGGVSLSGSYSGWNWNLNSPSADSNSVDGALYHS